MTLSQLEDQFEYWKKYPPTHELARDAVGFKPELSIEEQWKFGAMSPEDFAFWVNQTDGRMAGPSG